MRVAEFFVALQNGAPCRQTLSIQGRSVAILASQNDVATAACRSLSHWRIPEPPTGFKPDDFCVVETYSRSGFHLPQAIPPSRRYSHPGMGTFLGYELPDGSAIVQQDRGAILLARTGEFVWLVEDALLAELSDRQPNLTDLAIVFTAEILRRGGFFLAHAGGIGRGEQCLLLAGDSGAGKTTLTLRNAMRGWDFYGDDMVIVGPHLGGTWRAYPFQRPIHLTQRTAELLGILPDLTGELTAKEKMQYAGRELCPFHRSTSGIVSAIICLRPDWAPKEPVLLSPTDALVTLGNTFLSGFNQNNAANDLGNLLDLLTATPVYQASWSTAPDSLEALLNHTPAYAGR